MNEAKTIDQFEEVVHKMKSRRLGMKAKDKIGWYYRYWPETETQAHTTQTWNDFISQNPLFNKSLPDPEKQAIIMSEVQQDQGLEEADLGSFF